MRNDALWEVALAACVKDARRAALAELREWVRKNTASKFYVPSRELLAKIAEMEAK